MVGNRQNMQVFAPESSQKTQKRRLQHSSWTDYHEKSLVESERLRTFVV